MELELPDGTILEIPDGMKPAELASQFQKAGKPLPPALQRFSQPPVAKPQQKEYGQFEIPGSVVEPALAMASGMFAKPIGDVAGLARLGMEGWRRLGIPGIEERDPMTVQRDVQNALTYEPRTASGQMVNEWNPLALLGRGVNWLAGKAESAVAPEATSGPWRNALGYGVHEAVNQLPMLLGMKAPGAAAATQEGLMEAARNQMTSALKPPLAAGKTGQTARAVDALLEEGVNVTKGGAEKLRERVDALNDAIAQRIDASPAVIDKTAVASRLQGLMDRFQKQVNPLSDVAAIQKAWDEFMRHPLLQGNDIPVKTAQEMKQSTYRALGSKSYGELKGADIEAQKTLARGLKDDIAAAVPEVQQLNAAESKMLDALSLVERRVLVSANKNPMGLAWLTANPVKFAGFMADRSELFKSLVARMLATGSRATPDLNVAGPLGGLAVTEQADQR